METYNYQKDTEYTFFGPIRRAFDITPAVDALAIPTRAIMVSEAATVTGYLVDHDSAEAGEEHTTHELVAGTLYPFAFSHITAVSAGTVKGYA